LSGFFMSSTESTLSFDDIQARASRKHSGRSAQSNRGILQTNPVQQGRICR
jgi:hypothetical protein